MSTRMPKFPPGPMMIAPLLPPDEWAMLPLWRRVAIRALSHPMIFLVAFALVMAGIKFTFQFSYDRFGYFGLAVAVPTVIFLCARASRRHF